MNSSEMLDARKRMRANVRSQNSRYERRNYRRDWQIWIDGVKVPLGAYVSDLIKAARGDKRLAFVYATCWAGTQLLERHYPEVYKAMIKRNSKGNEEKWEPPCWSGQSWCRNPETFLHYPHVSKENPEMLAYTQSVDKLLADVQTRIKPGRYLAKFFGPGSDNPVLTEAECKHWADRQVALSKPSKIYFIENDDPAGWEWVYENSPSSCMRYNRSDRYLNGAAYGNCHPVRAYAHPDNDLALAFIMVPGHEYDRSVESDMDEYVVSARTIINRSIEGWQRIYANDDRERAKLRKHLDEMGYQEDDRVLHDQKMERIELEDGTVVCPYLDNGVAVDVYDRYLVARHSGDYDAQNSSGLLDCDREECSECGDRISRDGAEYTEDGEALCTRCIDRYYVWAYVRHSNKAWIRKRDAVYCEDTDEYYREDLAESYGVYQCEGCGVYHLEDEIHNTESGCYCDRCVDTDDVTEEVYPSHEMRTTSYDGCVHMDSVVITYPHLKTAHFERCYTLDFANDSKIYVHRSVLEDPAMSIYFKRFGDLLVTDSMLGEPIKEPFVPENISEGEYCDYGDDVLTECWASLCEIKEAA